MRQSTGDSQEEKSAYGMESGWESGVLVKVRVRGRKVKEGVIEWGKG